MSNQKTVYVVPTFHYDTEYLRPYEEYRDLCVENIAKAVELLLQHPNYHFMVEQVILLEEFWQRYPELREALTSLIAQGRFEVACGMYCCPDMNLPHGEFFMEQALRGKRWLRDKFGMDVEVCWIADSFGQHSALPQMVQHCGYRYFFFVRGGDARDVGDFLWEGIDGTEMVTVKAYKGYSTLILRQDNITNANDLNVALSDGREAVVQSVQAVEHTYHTDAVLCVNGGDFMPPQAQLIPLITGFPQDGAYQVHFGAARDFFHAIDGKEAALPKRRGEYQDVMQGCYSTHQDIKIQSRLMEHKVFAIERLALLLKQRGIVPPQDFEGKLDELKRLVLYNHFHDIICGSIVDAAYIACVHRMKTMEGLSLSLQSAAFEALGTAGSGAINLFNPSAYDRSDAVSVSLRCVEQDKKGLVVSDGAGNPVPCQWRETEPGRTEVSFVPLCRALSVTSYSYQWVESAQAPVPLSGDFCYENAYYRAVMNGDGILTSLKNSKGEQLVDPNRPRFNELYLTPDRGDAWLIHTGPSNGAYPDGAPFRDPYVTEDYGVAWAVLGRSTNSGKTAHILEQGPVKTVVRITGTVGFWRIQLPYTMDVTFYAHSPRIDCKVGMDFCGEGYRLRACFPTTMPQGTMVQEIPFGQVERPLTQEAPAQNYTAYHDGNKGVILLNKGLAGNNVDDGVMMLSLMRSTSMEYKTQSQAMYKKGEHMEFAYSILPFAGELFDQQPWRHGGEFNLPLLPQAGGQLPEGASLLCCPCENVVVSRLYEGEQGMIVRLYEAGGKAAHTTLTVVDGLTRYTVVDGMERAVGEEAPIPTGGIPLSFGPFEIKTLRLR